ncbi:hypothetical protein LAZ67_3005258 [Cordylochernes scorpioides]|uniref:Uncharacterized protein n=1 Tax=Cordylochernes scorpioides TaxID=51811 RepID=A0ABY6KEX3_9ARAC|nr:hypothetical protein LAZ67_3005258 [Cordylochernes scorpioides]
MSPDLCGYWTPSLQPSQPPQEAVPSLYGMFVFVAVFGRELSEQFTPGQQAAPSLVLQCIQELELRAQQRPGQ